VKLPIAKFAHAFCYNLQLGPISSLAQYCPTGTWNVQVQKHEVVCVTFERMKETTTDTVFWNMTPCWLVVNDVSEQLATSIFRVAQEKNCELAKKIAPLNLSEKA